MSVSPTSLNLAIITLKIFVSLTGSKCPTSLSNAPSTSEWLLIRFSFSRFIPLVLITVLGWRGNFGAVMLIHKPDVLWGISYPLILQISRERTRASAVRSRCLTTLDIARPETELLLKNVKIHFLPHINHRFSIFRYVMPIYFKTRKRQITAIFEQVRCFI